MNEFKGTPGNWRWVEYTSNELPELVNDENQKVCGFGNNYEYYPTEGEPPNKYDALLISKAPEMLEMMIKAKNKFVKLMAHPEWVLGKFGSVWEEYSELEKLIKEATEL